MPRILLALVALWVGAWSAAIAQPALPCTGKTDPLCKPIDDLMVSFMTEHKLPGAALAIAKGDRLVYARGFGLADPDHETPVQPESLFRIASVSKPLTSAAILLLVEQGKVKLDDHPFVLLGIEPPEGQKADERLAKITVRDLLMHAGGFDRGKSGDPMFMSRQIAADLHIPSPPPPREIIRWMSGRPLDFDPGTASVYSNFGYCVLGRVIELASGQTYERFVQERVLRPLGITRMRIGASLESGRADGEVRYISAESAGPAVFDGVEGTVPNAYGRWCLESMDSHGGWIASAPDLVRFATGLSEPGRVLANPEALWARPAYADPNSASYYAFGWAVHGSETGGTISHNGSLPGTGTLLVRRRDGLSWAILFNTREGNPAGAIDPLLHKAFDSIKEWPSGEPLFTAGSSAPPASGAR